MTNGAHWSITALSSSYYVESDCNRQCCRILRRWFGFYHGLFSLVQTLAVLYYYGLPYMWRQTGALLDLLTSRTGYTVLQHEITHTIAFLLAVTVISMVVEMPWGLYSTFVVEQKHGFNKQTLGLYFTDIAKQASCCWACRMLLSRLD